ncbi:hypothetical protein DMENIID0001_167090 [Sergentomyia squamirostris]
MRTSKKTPTESRYDCKECEKSYRYSGHLENHMIIHTGLRPYLCEHCGKSFVFKSTYKSHLRIHKKFYECTDCNEFFPTPRAQSSHFRTLHQKKTTMNCSRCGHQAFNSVQKKPISCSDSVLCYTCSVFVQNTTKIQQDCKIELMRIDEIQKNDDLLKKADLQEDTKIKEVVWMKKKDDQEELERKRITEKVKMEDLYDSLSQKCNESLHQADLHEMQTNHVDPKIEDQGVKMTDHDYVMNQEVESKTQMRPNYSMNQSMIQQPIFKVPNDNTEVPIIRKVSKFTIKNVSNQVQMRKNDFDLKFEKTETQDNVNMKDYEDPIIQGVQKIPEKAQPKHEIQNPKRTNQNKPTAQQQVFKVPSMKSKRIKIQNVIIKKKTPRVQQQQKTTQLQPMPDQESEWQNNVQYLQQPQRVISSPKVIVQPIMPAIPPLFYVCHICSTAFHYRESLIIHYRFHARDSCAATDYNAIPILTTSMILQNNVPPQPF